MKVVSDTIWALKRTISHSDPVLLSFDQDQYLFYRTWDHVSGGGCFRTVCYGRRHHGE